MLVLASSSPRRSALLEMAGFAFQTAPTRTDESYARGTPPVQVVELLAARKARAAAALYPDDTVLAADTAVVFRGRVFGKPKDEAAAREMLRALSGNVHQVYTGYCVLRGGEAVTGHECTSVEFYPLKDAEIDRYLATGEPMDKAGAYGIQGRGALFVRRINGDFYNVVGLPLGKICRILNRLAQAGEDGRARS